MNFQPANEQILKFRSHFVKFLFFVEPTKTDFSPKASKFTSTQFKFVFCQIAMFSISVAIVCSLKVESQILSFKICEELSAVQMLEKAQIRDNKTRLFMS